jgi:hypothetical protein
MSSMKRLLVLGLIVCLVAGCMTLRPVTGNPADVHQRMASGALQLNVGKTALAVGLTVVVAAAAAAVVIAVGAHRSSAVRTSRGSTRFAQPVPPPLLPLPQNNQLVSCDAPSFESEGQEDRGAGTHARRCAK